MMCLCMRLKARYQPDKIVMNHENDFHASYNKQLYEHFVKYYFVLENYFTGLMCLKFPAGSAISANADTKWREKF